MPQKYVLNNVKHIILYMHIIHAPLSLQLAAFPKWGGICDNGKKQSPINLHTKGVLKGKFDPLKFDNYDEHQSSLQMVNNGHSSE